MSEASSAMQSGVPSVCVVGGCHVIGHAVGEYRSFATLCARELYGEGTRVDAVPYVKFKHLSKVTSACERSRPALLIAQCGNFEATPPPFSERWSGVRKRASASIGSGGMQSADDCFKLGLGVRLRFAAKRVADRLICWRAFDAEQLGREIQAFVDHLNDIGIPRVVVIAPLRTMDPVINRYRKLVGGKVRAACALRRVPCVDPWEVLADPKLFLPDGVHLNAAGHRRLAAEIVMLISKEEAGSNLVAPRTVGGRAAY